MRYKIVDEDESYVAVVDTELAAFSMPLGTVKARYGLDAQTLYRSSQGNWWMEHRFDYDVDGRNPDFAEFVTPFEASRLILLQQALLPEGFAELTSKVLE